jgi:hypothetical protein
MKRVILMAAVAGWICLPLPGSGHAAYAQNLLGEGAIVSMDASTPAQSADAPIYADGIRAINEMRWSDAVAIFTRMGKDSGDHADGALFWKAYAENKLNNYSQALEDCTKLRSEHADSKWLDECGALEIEIWGKTGKPVQPQAQTSDDLKLLALATLMQHDEKRALQEIDEILNSDSPEKLKQGALFIMGEHHTDTEYPQIVRLSYVEGDVRVSRGEKKKHDKNSGWEQAAADLPLETGYSLVTGNGRAEVELEDASTIYLAENSVLMLNDLHTVGGVPYTEMALLTGTATLHVKPYVSGELFVLHMPTDSLVTKYSQVTDLRVSSYTDGIALTSLAVGTLGLNGAVKGQVLALGTTLYFKNGKRTIDAGPIQQSDFTAWDKWVADRYTARETAMTEMLKASGLTNPVPGMADMQGQGRFVDCQPYGTCWEPNQAPGQPSPAQTEVAQTSSPEARPAQAGQTPEPQNSTGQGTKRNIGFIGAPSPTTPPAEWGQMMYMFPCMPGEVQAQMILGIYPGANLSSFNSAAFQAPRWAWALCHSGSWLYRGNRYMWVAGRCHHHPPVHWIRYGDKVAVVPVHPHDVKNHAPVSHNNPVFIVNPKGGHLIERTAFPTGHRVELLNEPPKGLRTVYAPPLQHADEPRMTARSINNNVQLARDGAVKTGPVPVRGPVPISFDHKTQTFMMAHQEMHGSRTVTVNAPISNHSGTLQSRAAGFSGGGTSSWNGGGRSGGGGGARGGGGGASGGAHASGGSSGSSGGGSHSGGGGSSGSSGSSGGSSGGGTSSGGGGHH